MPESAAPAIATVPINFRREIFFIASLPILRFEGMGFLVHP
jgi:hypothetical protein